MFDICNREGAKESVVSVAERPPARKFVKGAEGSSFWEAQCQEVAGNEHGSCNYDVSDSELNAIRETLIDENSNGVIMTNPLLKVF